MLTSACLANDHFAVPTRTSETRLQTTTSTHHQAFPEEEPTPQSQSQLGTLLADIHLYDRVCAGDVTVSESQESIEARLDLAIPILIDLGVFEIYKPEQWLMGDSMGKKFIGISAKLLGC